MPRTERSPLLPATARLHALSGRLGESRLYPRLGLGHSRSRSRIPAFWRRPSTTTSSSFAAAVNALWLFVPVAVFLRYATDYHAWTFAASCVGIVPAAALLGLTAQEITARISSPGAGLLVRTAAGSVAEIVLFVVLLLRHDAGGRAEGARNFIPFIQAAIVGSILTNLLLCPGLHTLIGRFRRQNGDSFNTPSSAVAEASPGVLLAAAFALLIPSAFGAAGKLDMLPRQGGIVHDFFTEKRLQENVLAVSREVSIVLVLAFALWALSCFRGERAFVPDQVAEAEAQGGAGGEDGEQAGSKVTTLDIVATSLVSVFCVGLLLVFVVEEIDHVVDAGLPRHFLGLIILPLIARSAEHLAAVRKAKKGDMDAPLYFSLAPSIQTALLNGPLAVLLGWVLNKPMDLNFGPFAAFLLLVSVLVVEDVVRSGKGSPLHGGMMVLVYFSIAIAAWHYPGTNVATKSGLVA